MEIIEHYRSRGEATGAEETALPDKMENAVSLYIQGVLMSSPWLLTTLGMLLTGVSIWPVKEVPIHFATVTGLATIISLTTSSIMYQVFVRRMLLYHYQ
ncbi:hypothetical protein CW702_03165, partial [Candidatus Bathyarchaeota archaeon]